MILMMTAACGNGTLSVLGGKTAVNGDNLFGVGGKQAFEAITCELEGLNKDQSDVLCEELDKYCSNISCEPELRAEIQEDLQLTCDLEEPKCRENT